MGSQRENEQNESGNLQWESGPRPDEKDDQRKAEQEKLREKIDRKKSSLKAAILAKCHDCSGHYQDGRVDCGVNVCSLYAYMPYRKLEPSFDWCKYNHKRSGKQLETYDADAAQAARDRFWTAEE
jgi:hypothetical protein